MRTASGASRTDSIIRLPAPLPEETPSPDEESALFLRGHDLWLRRRASGEEVRLTWDGVEDCDYGRLVDYDASITMERTGYVPASAGSLEPGQPEVSHLQDQICAR